MKRLVLCAMLLLAFVNVNAQKDVKFYNDVTLSANFLSGASDAKDYMKSVDPLNYSNDYILTAGFGYNCGYSFNNKLFIDLNVKFNYGSNIFNDDNYQKQEDFLAYINFSYNFLQTNISENSTKLSLNLGVGVGISNSSWYYSSETTAIGVSNIISKSFSSNNLILPFTFTMWFGKQINPNQIGVYLQYVLAATQLGDTKYTGLDAKMDQFNIKPSTLSLGVTYRL